MSKEPFKSYILYIFKMSMVYNEMLTKKKQVERLAQKGHNKYEYDSDEDTEVRIILT